MNNLVIIIFLTFVMSMLSDAQVFVMDQSAAAQNPTIICKDLGDASLKVTRATVGCTNSGRIDRYLTARNVTTSYMSANKSVRAKVTDRKELILCDAIVAFSGIASGDTKTQFISVSNSASTTLNVVYPVTIEYSVR